MDSRVELRHLRYFLALAEELHFGRAAARLHIAQPALSQQIRQLEELMGVTLFARTSRSVELTEAGSGFRPRAQGLLALLASDVDEARRVARGESGRIDISFISSGAGIVSTILHHFTRSRPNVLVELHEGPTTAVLDRLERGTADVGIVRDADEHAGLTVSTLFAEPFVAVLPASHALAGAAAVTATQLASSPLVLFPQASGSRAHSLTLQPFREAGIEPWLGLSGSEWGTIFHLVAAGLGVAVSPASAAAPLPRGAVAVPLASTGAVSLVQLAHRASDANPLVRAFSATAAEVRAATTPQVTATA
ncbi:MULTISPECIES: LysR family transcriptional regulator [unclassified Pseudoclavibacter]|uniref:LysR family transcriptional regulator n=1 Tax=unclassified Pseudoclavibacter TaxID=2615177 RepID=UPI000CE76145|nr:MULTISPECIES: LysR substrate-binding domain-containing protein [unclassified Pseudoclavibacter]PPF34524.1 LysR family transcriptional regulator [Pseudoclavibacter sp. AY1H1]PPF72292.1 LysR family transcriptional regulator [Pseudoclavibacter sp. Z016]